MNLDFHTFRDRFYEKVNEYQINWEVIGFLSANHQVYPFTTDTKVLSSVFEGICRPLVNEIADEYGYIMDVPFEQNVYPDFTLSPATGDIQRIAIDVKTTYRSFSREGKIQPLSFTLGSYTSFLRTPGAKKNIHYPYSEYVGHWIIGFVYTRTEIKEQLEPYYALCEIGTLPHPYHNVEYFIQEKYKIAGEKPGSGNTANIGSFKSKDIEDFRQGRGPFASLGKDLCDQYWRHFGQKASERDYNTVKEFLDWWREKGDSA
jgi:hypothetical protein